MTLAVSPPQFCLIDAVTQTLHSSSAEGKNPHRPQTLYPDKHQPPPADLPVILEIQPR